LLLAAVVVLLVYLTLQMAAVVVQAECVAQLQAQAVVVL